jgi:opacity protein-like surface antigen
MLKSLFSSVILISIIASNSISAQDDNSIQISGGLIMPMSASNGFTSSIQFNYNFNQNIQFYIYSGYSSWDKFYVNYIEDYSTTQKQTLFETYTSDNHILIPVYIGSRINFHTNKLFTSFVTFEVGYSYLSYNSYNIKKEIDPATGEVLSYNPDLSTKKEITENLIGLGAGAGISYPISKNINIILSYRLNSQLNSKYYDFFSSEGTYSAFNLGFNFSI